MSVVGSGTAVVGGVILFVGMFMSRFSPQLEVLAELIPGKHEGSDNVGWEPLKNLSSATHGMDSDNKWRLVLF